MKYNFQKKKKETERKVEIKRERTFHSSKNSNNIMPKLKIFC